MRCQNMLNAVISAVVCTCVIAFSALHVLQKGCNYIKSCALSIHFDVRVHQASRVLPLRYWMLMIFCCFIDGAHAVGRDTPKQTFDENFLPGVSKWNGIPFHTFRTIWWIGLTVALGSITQDGWTLLQTANNQDQGSPGNPGTPAQTVQSQNRNQRLFACILNYIEANSMVYRYVSANFANNGRGLFAYLYVFGHLPYAPDVVERLRNEWEDATMFKAGIRYTADAVFRWAEYLHDLAQKINKTNRDLRNKYLDGFPDSFDVVVVPERLQPGAGSYTFPAVHPAHHPDAGNPHPYAGQPDIQAMAFGFYPEWSRMISRGKIKAVPRGMAHLVSKDTEHDGFEESSIEGGQADDVSTELAQPITRSQISAKMVCLYCGGLGHPSRLEGIGECFSKTLKIEVPKADLLKMVYPHGVKRPEYKQSQSKNSYNHKAGPSGHAVKRGKYPPKRKHEHVKKKHAKQVEQHDEQDEQNEENSSEEDEIEEAQHEVLAVKFEGMTFQ